MRAITLFIIFALISDILHRADGHQCSDECPYPWGKRTPFMEMINNES